jgi:hypothetical protein
MTIAENDRRRQAIDRVEDEIVGKLLPAREMAHELGQAYLRKRSLEPGALLIDGLCFGVGLALALTPVHAGALPALLSHVAGALTATIAGVAAVMSRLPLGKMAVAAVAALRLTKYGCGIGIAVNGSSAVVGTLSWANAGHAWSGSLHVDVSAAALAGIALILQVLQRKELARAESGARRYLNLHSFRDEHFFSDKDRRQRDDYIARRPYEYFTQEEL